MERRILKGFIIIALTVLIISTVSSQAIYYNFHEKSIKENLNSTAQLLQDGINNMGEKEAVNYLSGLKNLNNGTRITYINEDGKVLFDSVKKTDENHANRPEFQEAKKYGVSTIKRFSHTISQKTYYIAMSLENKNVIRVSIQTNNIFKTFSKVIQADVLISVVIFMISVYLSRYATKKIIEPLNQSSLDIENLNLKELPEMKPFINKIRKQNKIITKQISQLEREKSTIETILQGMKEGIIILDEDKNILLMNRASKNILKTEKNIIDKNYRYLAFNENLLRSIEKAYKGEEEEKITEINDRKIKYIINVIKINGEIEGTIILLIDETEEERIREIKDDFSANVSHELKTPVTSIYGFSEMLSNGMVKSEEDKKEIIDTIYKESKRMLNLINDIIRISQIENEDISKSEVDIGDSVDKVVASLDSDIKSKNIKVVKEGEARTEANETMIWELLTNLIENAVKYNKENGEISIKLSQKGKRALIEISDTGIGISDKDIDRVFERFYRSDKSRSKKYGGTGLGLCIVKHIVQSHNGKIDVESELGKGTKITVEI